MSALGTTGRRLFSTPGRPGATIPIAVAVCVCAGALLALTLGSYPMTMGEAVLALVRPGMVDETMRTIVVDTRLPRILLALLSGMAMGLSGLVLQTVTRNALAAPGLVGVEAGAGLTMLLALVLFPSALPVSLYPLAALGGGASVALLIALLAWRGGFAPLRLVLVGVGVTAMLGAVVDVIVTYGRIDEVESALLWLAGSLHRVGWENVASQAIWLCLGGLPLLFWLRHLDLFQLGEAVAATRGLSTSRFQIQLLLCSVTLTASAVSNVGTMSFVGLLAPHAARLIVADRHALLVPLTGLLGAGIVLLADTIGRTVFAPLQIPAGLVVAAVGAPYLLFLLSRSGRTHR